MEVIIHKGTNQIGGCITEIRTNKTRIIIDFGEDLPSEEETNIKPLIIKGLNDNKESLYNAVFITHSHGDHIGKINEINKDIDVYVEEYTKLIHNLTCEFTRKETITRPTKNIKFGETIIINNDIKVTPYIVDHSSYNSCMYLIEADNKKVVHTGDYRNHGKKGIVFEDNIKKIGKIDALITEGTTLSREVDKYETEDSLYKKAIDIFNSYDDILILQSSTNIDRLVSFYKAALKTNKNFVEDLFSATIASNISKTIPSPISNHPNVSVWIPYKYRNKPQDFKEKYTKPMEQYRNNSVFHKNVCMMVKQSMLEDIKFLKDEKHKFKNACLIYSMWEGYLDDEDMNKFKEEIENMNIKFIKLHTSGHADVSAMEFVRDNLKPDKVITIHTKAKENAKNIFDNCINANDNEIIIV